MFTHVINQGKHPPLPLPASLMQHWFCDPRQTRKSSYLLKKILQRKLAFWMSGQHSLHRHQIPKNTQKILWIHITDHVGDTIMRLSSSALLKNKDVDLYVNNSNIAKLFHHHPYFKNVYDSKDDDLVKNITYDLVIIEGITTQFLKIKKHLQPHAPFVTINEYFDHTRHDYNQMQYAFLRMDHLLTGQTDIDLLQHVHTSIGSLKNIILPYDLTRPTIMLAVGGRVDYRVYHHWPAVVGHILEHHRNYQILLVGSENGLFYSMEILKKYGLHRIINAVAKHTLMETAALISQCKMAILCDGGLLHLVNLFSMPKIVLFAQLTPDFYFPKSLDSHTLALVDDENVNNISPELIIKQINNVALIEQREIKEKKATLVIP